MHAPLTDDVRRYLASIGTGWKVFSRDKRSMVGKMVAARVWATRRARYGVSGRKNGASFLKAHKGKLDAVLAWSGNGNPDSKQDGKS